MSDTMLAIVILGGFILQSLLLAGVAVLWLKAKHRGAAAAAAILLILPGVAVAKLLVDQRYYIIADLTVDALDVCEDGDEECDYDLADIEDGASYEDDGSPGDVELAAKEPPPHQPVLLPTDPKDRLENLAMSYANPFPVKGREAMRLVWDYGAFPIDESTGCQGYVEGALELNDILVALLVSSDQGLKTTAACDMSEEGTDLFTCQLDFVRPAAKGSFRVVIDGNDTRQYLETVRCEALPAR